MQPVTHCPTCRQPLAEPPPCDALEPRLVADVLPTRCVLGAGHEGWHQGPEMFGTAITWTKR